MADGQQGDGLENRIVRLETKLETGLSDIKDVKHEIRELRDEYQEGRRAPSRTEKLMFSGIAVTAIGTVTAVVTLLVGAH